VCVCLLLSPDEGSDTAHNLTEDGVDLGDVNSNSDEIDDDVDIDAEDDMLMSDVADTCSESDVMEHELSDAESQEGNGHLEQPVKLPRTCAGPPGITSWSMVKVVPYCRTMLGRCRVVSQ